MRPRGGMKTSDVLNSFGVKLRAELPDLVEASTFYETGVRSILRQSKVSLTCVAQVCVRFAFLLTARIHLHISLLPRGLVAFLRDNPRDGNTRGDGISVVQLEYFQF